MSKFAMRDIQSIAEMAYEVNRAYCAIVDPGRSIVAFDDAPLETRESVVIGVQHLLDNPEADPAEMHDFWMKTKIAQGYIHGHQVDHGLKTHPNLVPWENLSLAEQAKDAIFIGVVRSVSLSVVEDSAEPEQQEGVRLPSPPPGHRYVLQRMD